MAQARQVAGDMQRKTAKHLATALHYALQLVYPRSHPPQQATSSNLLTD
jgi:hypothetical protein